MTILAIDLGKFNSVACLCEESSGDHSFRTFRTDRQTLHDLLVELAPEVLVIETCSLAGWIHDLATSLGVKVLVANPSHEGWRWKRVKRKTDRDDALKLARLTAMNQLPTVYMPERSTREWRSFIAYRHKLVGRQTAIRNNIRSILLRQGLSMPRGFRAWTQAGVEELDELAHELDGLAMGDLWRGMLKVELEALRQVTEQLALVTKKLDAISGADHRVRRLRTVPGVGPRLAEILVATIDDPHRFRNARQVSSYAGLTPKSYESGQMRRQGRISRQGPPLMRGLLVEVSWLVRRYNAWGEAVFQHITKGQRSRRKQAIVALARRLLVRCWAMLRDGTDWRASPAA